MTSTTVTWNPQLYNTAHSFVAAYGQDVLPWLDAQPTDRILDLGCGTGTLTNAIYQITPSVVGLDNSKEMLSQAKAAFPHLNLFNKNATHFDFDTPFDAVFSNATLHWINEQEAVLSCVFNCLKKGGRFIFEMGGKHNIASIYAAVVQAMTEQGWGDKIPAYRKYFPSPAEQSTLLEKIGFTIAQLRYFDRPTALVGINGMQHWIAQFCAFFFVALSPQQTETVIEKAVAILKPNHFKNNIWYVDYVRLRMKALKL